MLQVRWRRQRSCICIAWPSKAADCFVSVAGRGQGGSGAVLLPNGSRLSLDPLKPWIGSRIACHKVFVENCCGTIS